MIRKKKKVPLAQLVDPKNYYSNRFETSISSASAKANDEDEINNKKFRSGNYSLRTRIRKLSWIKNGRPASEAIRWLFKEVFKDSKKYAYNKLLLEQGNLFIFEYKNPKYKDTNILPWFDKYPLVLSLGPVATEQGIRNIGFNLHLLPPKIRVIVLCAIFEMYKKVYRYQIFVKQDKPVGIKYKTIVKTLARMGVGFAIRMYIPSRIRQIVKFPFKDWHKAIFIPSRGYYGIYAERLIKEWQKYVRNNGFATSKNLDWKTNI